MNKELMLEALDTLKTQMQDYMDANDAHLSTWYVTKLSEINEEINKLNTNTNG